MPIYAYRCEACGYAKDVLQKMSDAPLTVCPECGSASFRKMVTAAGFQLKGAGWYVTDFREQGGRSTSRDAKDGGQKSDSAAKNGESAGAVTSPSPGADTGSNAPAAAAKPGAEASQ